MRKKKNEEVKENNERWLLTYSDMMNNLLILFMVLYAMSVIDLNKFEALATQFSNIFSTTEVVSESGNISDLDEISIPTDSSGSSVENTATISEQFDEAYESITEKLKESGYDKYIIIEKGDNYIKFRFGDNVLFYPDSPVMKPNDAVLLYIGDIIYNINPLIQTIEIGGHTATTGEKTNSFFSWELSSERALAVLETLVMKCDLPEAKMSISGFSRYHPVASNDSEESRQLNRRVEITVTRLDSTATTTGETNTNEVPHPTNTASK